MDALNAGRTDADHYDPEDFTHPEDWQIDDTIMTNYIIFKKMRPVRTMSYTRQDRTAPGHCQQITYCRLKDYFDHKQFVVYFSALKALIKDNWTTIGRSSFVIS